MKKDAKELSPRQRQALPCFLNANSIIECCKKAGISPKTYYEWMNETPFKEALEKEKSLLREEALSILKLSLPRAVKTLSDLLETPNESVRRLAAKDIMEHV